jgi:hypothetical protein
MSGVWCLVSGVWVILASIVLFYHFLKKSVKGKLRGQDTGVYFHVSGSRRALEEIATARSKKSKK